MLNISIRQLRTLLAVHKHGKISAAAKALGLTSPAVTLQLQQLEQDLGCQLFLRTKTGSQPTEIGEIAIQTARRVISELTSFEETVQAHKGVAAGTIRLGVVSTGKYFAPRLIAAFTEKHPGVSMTLVAANRSEIIQKLHDHDIDVALMGRPPTSFKVHAALFGDHPLVFIANPDHPLVGRIDITREQLASQKFIVREKGSGTRSSFEFFMSDSLERLRTQPTEMDSNETIKQAVIAGLGIAFISGHTIEQECLSGKLVILDVEDTPIRRQWFSIRHSSRTSTPALQALDDFLRIRGPSLLPVISKPYPAPPASPSAILTARGFPD
ncbi:LysR substrate-binding domain-containing protein [Hoeflea olei]|uniref:HTH-type transcriptional regulator CbbR n=1 Tax=Hoeflea olei TaxID=1480615 RepID=A0A1C1YWP5_9HYPH|nr:LysR substrate-binding domain-containing protein [Hoeflea olei]OCW57840.1 LysR family transcriptional regulator [Hoeflea olei]